MWKCPKCGEEIEAQFDSCWKCAGPPPDATVLRRAPSGALFLGLVVVPAVLFGLYCLMWLPFWWPPRWIERRTQRTQVIERIESAGGWAALRRDCDALVQQQKDNGFHWWGWDTNGLPPALSALKPREIEFHPEAARPPTQSPQTTQHAPPYELALPPLPGAQIDFKTTPKPEVVRIEIFGGHSTGRRSPLYYGLEIVSGAGADRYKPPPPRAEEFGMRRRIYRKLTDRIYEVY